MERHLERSFYNHTALTPADWQTYCLLASLAQERFGLHVPAPALPEHKLSEGAHLHAALQTSDLLVSLTPCLPQCHTACFMIRMCGSKE